MYLHMEKGSKQSTLIKDGFFSRREDAVNDPNTIRAQKWPTLEPTNIPSILGP